MANYGAAEIKKLREQTGAGMLDCKKALDEVDGDYEKAVEFLRVKGLKGVAKREGRATSNGLVALNVDGGVGTMIELNCETDFVAKGEKFIELSERVLALAVDHKAGSAESLLEAEADGQSIQAILDEANAQIGERIVLRRVARVEAPYVAHYEHRTNPDLPPQIGVLVGLSSESDAGRDVAMHAAAMSPTFLTRDEVASDVVENERRIAEETAKEEGKPEKAIPKIVEGRVNSYFKDNVLLEQPFAKDPKKKVEQVLKEAGAEAVGFARFRVGN